MPQLLKSELGLPNCCVHDTLMSANLIHVPIFILYLGAKEEELMGRRKMKVLLHITKAIRPTTAL